MPGRRPPPRSLPRGRHALDAEATATTHRERLQAATVELLCEQGYGETTVHGIAARANVAAASVYSLYGGKEQLALAAWEAAATRLGDALDEAPPAPPTSLRAALSHVLDALVRAVVARPQEARMAIVEVLAIGADGPALRRRLADRLARRLRDAARTPDGVPISDGALAVVAGGTLQVIDQHLRSGRLRPLRAAAHDLAAWGATYETLAPVALPTRDAHPYGRGTRPRSPHTLSLPHGRHGLPAAFVRRHQRARILETVVALAAEHGCESITLRQITAEAQISNETFYSYFPTRDAALRKAYERAFVELYAQAWYAAADHDDDWPSEVTAVMTAWTQHIAAEPDLAHFGLSQALSGGPEAMAQADDACTAFARLITRDRPEADDDVPSLVPYAVASGIASLAAAWVADGRAAELVNLGPQLVYVVLAPFLGEPAARKAAGLDARARPDPGGTASEARQRLMLGFAESVQERGYAATQLSDVAQRSGIELDVAHQLFEDELDCATQAIDAWGRPLVLIAAGAFLSARGDPPLAGHRALDAALHYLADHAALTTLALIDEPLLLAVQTTARERCTDMFFALVEQDAPAPVGAEPSPQLVLHMMVNGIVAVARRFLTEGRLSDLPAELPQISQQVLTLFFGPERAARVAAEPAADASSQPFV